MMSSIDPDLKPTEGNRPIAIDVVDGQLVVKRHNGKKESFVLGGGINQRPDQLQLSYQVLHDGTGTLDPQTDVANGSNLEMGVGYLAYGNPGSIGGINVTDNLATDYQINDDYALYDNDYTILGLKTVGVYKVYVNAFFDDNNVGSRMVQVVAGSDIFTSQRIWRPIESGKTSDWSDILIITEPDLVSSLVIQAGHTADVSLNVSVDLFLSRVL
jgi:hypothetical protein